VRVKIWPECGAEVFTVKNHERVQLRRWGIVLMIAAGTGRKTPSTKCPSPVSTSQRQIEAVIFIPCSVKLDK
jgi:hypothetical protein